MKKLTAMACIAILALIAIGCASSPAEPETDPNFIGDYEVIELDLLQLNTVPQGKPKLVAREVGLSFYPQTNYVHFYFKHELNKVSLYLDQAARAAMIEGLQRYIDSYRKGTLTKKEAGKKAVFGSAKGAMGWGLMGPTYYAYPTYRFEYVFIEERPYLVVANASSPETSKEGKLIKGGTNSPAIKLALSPVQAQRMIELLDQETLVGLVREKEAASLEFDLPAETENEAVPEYDNTAEF